MPTKGDVATMRSNAGAAIGLVALLFTVPSSGIATAATMKPFYTKQCWTNYTPPLQAFLSANKDGVITWNGDPHDWDTIQNYLADIPNAMNDYETGNFAMMVDEKTPHRQEIIDALAKSGLTFHQCEDIPRGIP